MRRPSLPRPSLRPRRRRAAKGALKAPAGPATPPPVGLPLPPHAADPHERIDGLRAWLAQVDRKLGIRTYLIGAIAVLAVAAGGAGLGIALSVQRDSATDDELAALREEVTAAKQTATEQAQRSIRTVNHRLDQLESDMTALTSDQRATKREVTQVQNDIDNLRDQISSLESSSSSTSTGTGKP